MLNTILQQNMLFYAMGTICILGVISQLVLNRLYGRLIRDGGMNGEPRGKFQKQVRQKFSSIKKVNEGAVNIQAYVKKSIYEYQKFGMNLHQWRRVGGWTLALCLAMAAFGYFYSSMQGAVQAVMINYLWAGAATLLLLGGTFAITDIKYKNQYLQTQLEDYLANSGIFHDYQEVSLSEPEHVRTKQEVPPVSIDAKKRQMRPVESRAQKDKRELKQNLAKIKEGLHETAADREKEKERNTEILRQMDPGEQERVIREVLKEFLS